MIRGYSYQETYSISLCKVPRLKVNLSKNTLSIININLYCLNKLAIDLGCSITDWTLSDLSLHFRGNSIAPMFWDLILGSIFKRLDGQKKAYLSVAGKSTLGQSSLGHFLLISFQSSRFQLILFLELRGFSGVSVVVIRKGESLIGRNNVYRPKVGGDQVLVGVP